MADTLRSDWITTGPKVARFEQAFAAYVGASAALGVDSCTAALHIALLSLGVGPGDAVITTPMTFCSTVHVIEHVGAEPILVDVEPDTLNLDPAAVEKVLERPETRTRVKALLPVHLYGHPCDLDSLGELAARYELPIVEDAAHALPASYKGQRIGSAAAAGGPPRLSCFSFYATKNLTTGEGGMLTGPRDLIDEARIWSLHGMSRDAYKRYGAEGAWRYDVVRPGFKYNMTDIAAAIGLQQLQKLDRFHARRGEIVARYNAAFAHVPMLELPVSRDDVEHAWHLYALRLNAPPGPPGAATALAAVARGRFIEDLKARNIGASVHFIPVHTLGYYRQKYGYSPEDFPVAFGQYQRLVSLPLHPRMTDDDVEDVIAAVTDIACVLWA